MYRLDDKIYVVSESDKEVIVTVIREGNLNQETQIGELQSKPEFFGTRDRCHVLRLARWRGLPVHL